MTVWLHVTASYFWTRPPVGILRVERELFAALEGYGMDLRYCIFVGGELYEVPANAMAEQIARQVSPNTPAALTILGNALREGAKAMFQTLARWGRQVRDALNGIEPQPSPAPHPRAACFDRSALQPSDDPIATAYG